MITADDVLAAIRNPAVGFSSEQIRDAWDALKVRHTQAQSMQAQTFRTGDKVTFMARGVTHSGVVLRVNTKTVAVQVGPVNWKVGANLLSKQP